VQVAQEGSKKGKKGKKGKKFFFCLSCSFRPFCFPLHKSFARPLAQVEFFSGSDAHEEALLQKIENRECFLIKRLNLVGLV
jgi:hypothetical protein